MKLKLQGLRDRDSVRTITRALLQVDIGSRINFDLEEQLVRIEGRLTLAEHGVPDFTWAEHEAYVGISTLETVTGWKARYGLNASVEELLAAKNRRYLELARASTRAYPEMRKFVELLAAEGVPMAVASGSSREAIEAVLTGTGLRGHFGIAVSAEDVEHGRRHIADVMELPPDAAPLGDARRPVHDQRVAHAAAVGVLLVALQRRVARHRPADRIVVVVLCLADLVDEG